MSNEKEIQRERYLLIEIIKGLGVDKERMQIFENQIDDLIKAVKGEDHE